MTFFHEDRELKYPNRSVIQSAVRSASRILRAAYELERVMNLLS